MFCPKCGRQLQDDDNFCAQCGSEIIPEQPSFLLVRETKNNNSGGIIILLIALAILGCIVYLYFNPNTLINNIVEDEHITFVKNGSPSSYPHITYDEAFSNFFSNRAWSYFKSSDGKDVVEFEGNCIYSDVEVRATIQFVLDMDESTFELSYLAFNDVPQSLLIEYALITKVFNSY